MSTSANSTYNSQVLICTPLAATSTISARRLKFGTRCQRGSKSPDGQIEKQSAFKRLQLSKRSRPKSERSRATYGEGEDGEIGRRRQRLEAPNEKAVAGWVVQQRRGRGNLLVGRRPETLVGAAQRDWKDDLELTALIRKNALEWPSHYGSESQATWLGWTIQSEKIRDISEHLYILFVLLFEIQIILVNLFQAIPLLFGDYHGLFVLSWFVFCCNQDLPICMHL